MPTALAMPCPRGPVVVSTPGVRPNSGWPGVREPSWRKAVDQGGAVAAGEDEAVAVGPEGGGGGGVEMLEPEDGGDVGHAHGHAGVSGVGLLDDVHGETAEGVGGGGVFGGGEAAHGEPFIGTGRNREFFYEASNGFQA